MITCYVRANGGLAPVPQTETNGVLPADTIWIDMLDHAVAYLGEFLDGAIMGEDPAAMRERVGVFDGDRADLELVDSKEQALEGADALVICTEWKAFKAPDFALVRDRLSRPLVFDGRNIYDPAIMSRNGFTYHGVGRLVPPAA